MQRLSPFALALLLLTLTACEPNLAVRLAPGEQQLPAPHFQVEDPAQPTGEPKFHTIEVYSSDDRIIWQARAENFGSEAGTRSFSYGQLPEGFRDLKSPEPLEPGGRYVLRVYGTAHGTVVFRADRQGRVHRSGS
jgi:hypothetical protein